MMLNRYLIFSLLLTSVFFNTSDGFQFRLPSLGSGKTTKDDDSTSTESTSTTTTESTSTTTTELSTTTKDSTTTTKSTTAPKSSTTTTSTTTPSSTTTTESTTTESTTTESTTTESTTTSSLSDVSTTSSTDSLLSSTETTPPVLTTAGCKTRPKLRKKIKKEEESNPTILIVSIVLGVVGILAVICSIVVGVCYRRSKTRQKKEQEEEVERRQQEIEEYQERLKKAQSQPKRKPNAAGGSATQFPQGWSQDKLKASQFKHQGALKINIDKPILMTPLYEDDELKSLESDKPFVWEDDQNIVFDIGSEVEELYKQGQKVQTPRRAKTPGAANRRPNEIQNLRAIRED